MSGKNTHPGGRYGASCPGEALRRRSFWSWGKGTKRDGREEAVEGREEDGTRKGERAEGKVGASAAAPRLTW